ncbi:B2 bradykinin receptor [Aplochiton taeniatus]
MVANTSEWIVPTVDPYFDPCSNYTAAWLFLSNLQPAYMGLLSVVGVVGNGLVLCVFCLQKKPCTVADIYLGNLAAADLVMVSCLPFWAVTIANGYQWAFGEALCKLLNVAISMNYYCSVLFLVLVSVDRYLALVQPMRPSRLRRAAWAKRICLGIWLFGFLLSLPILLFRTVTYVVDPGVDACILAYPHPGWMIQHNVTQNILGFLVPVVVVTFCSCHIVAALSDDHASRVSGMRAERKATHLVLAVLAVFLFCWTPHQVMRFLDTLDYFQVTPGCLWGHILDISIQLSTYLAYSNSAANPFLFVIVGKQFRKRAKDVLGKNLSPCLKDNAYFNIHFTSLNKSNDTQRIYSDQLVLPQNQTPI